MALRLKITDRYISKEFFSVFFYVLCACAIVLLISRIFDEFDDVMASALSLGTATRYFLLMLPFRLLEVVPLATVLAVIFSVGTLARNREMLAITAGGQSPYRSAVPVLVSTLGIAVGSMVLNETLVPYCQEMVSFIKEVHIDGGSELSLTRRQHVFDRGIGRTFFMAREFDSRRNRLYEVKIFEQYGDKGWRWCMTAERGDLIEEDAEPGRDRWRFEKAIVRTFDQQGRPKDMVSHTKPLDLLLEADLPAYLSSRKEPDQMNLAELGRYIRILKLRGENVSVYTTDWYLKLAFPFSTVVLAVIAFSLAIRAHVSSLPMAFGAGIFLTMLFYAAAGVGQNLGHLGLVQPLLGSLGPMTIFLALGICLLRRSSAAV